MPAMIVILKGAADKSQRELFVAAVLSDESAVRELAATLRPEPPRRLIVKSADGGWPAYIIEDDLGFALLPDYAVAPHLRAYIERRGESRAPPDYFAANLYRLEEPYIPEDPLRDSMGAIPHFHLTDESVERMAEMGPEAWIAWRFPLATDSENE